MGSSPRRSGRPAWPAWPAGAVLAAGAVGLMAGCASATGGVGAGPSATPSGSATTSSSIPCGTVTSLRTALVNLTHVKPSVQASAQIATDLISVKAQLEALRTTTDAYVAKTRPLDQAVDHVGLAASAVLSHPSSTTLAALVSALGGLKASLPPMIAEMKALCPIS